MSGGGLAGGLANSGGGLFHRAVDGIRGGGGGGPAPGGKPNGPPPPNTYMPARPDKFNGMPQMPNTNFGVWQPDQPPGMPYAPPTRGGPDPQSPALPPRPQFTPGTMMPPRFNGASGVPMNVRPGMQGPSAPMPYPTYRGGIGMLR